MWKSSCRSVFWPPLSYSTKVARAYSCINHRREVWALRSLIGDSRCVRLYVCLLSCVLFLSAAVTTPPPKGSEYNREEKTGKTKKGEKLHMGKWREVLMRAGMNIAPVVQVVVIIEKGESDPGVTGSKKSKKNGRKLTQITRKIKDMESDGHKRGG